jgi:hypothetical protein
MNQRLRRAVIVDILLGLDPIIRNVHQAERPCTAATIRTNYAVTRSFQIARSAYGSVSNAAIDIVDDNNRGNPCVVDSALDGATTDPLA